MHTELWLDDIREREREREISKRTRRCWYDNNKMGLTEVGCDDIDCIQLFQGTVSFFDSLNNEKIFSETLH